MITGIITDIGLSIDINSIINKYGKSYYCKLLNQLLIVEKHNNKKPKGSPIINIKGYCFDTTRSIVIVPKLKAIEFLNRGILNEVKDYDYDSIPINSYESPVMPLYDYQKKIVEHIIDNYYVNTKTNNICYLQMDTGLGKTRIGCSLINYLKCSTLIVVPTIAIGEQWIEECNELYPLMTIGKYSKKVTLGTHDVIVIVINSLRNKSTNFVKGFGFVIFDEAHEYYTSINRKVLWLIGSIKYVLGLSATPLERPDGLDHYVTLHLGKPIKARDITDIKFTKFLGKVTCIQYYGNTEYTKTVTLENGMISSILTINNIISDPYRMEVIVNEIKRLHGDNHGVFVFAEHREFLTVIKKYLLQVLSDTVIIMENELDNEEIYNIETQNISILKGGISKETLLQTKKRGKHVVLTTYGYSRRGISLVEMTSMVLTTPRRNGLRQIIGRILRKGSDETIVREIVDIVDMRTVLHTQFNDRKTVYNEKEFTINYKRIHDTSDLPPPEPEEPIINIQDIIDSIYDLEM